MEIINYFMELKLLTECRYWGSFLYYTFVIEYCQLQMSMNGMCVAVCLPNRASVYNGIT